MDPLAAVECQISEVTSWPTLAIYDLFLEDPRKSSLKYITAFFYENNINKNDAVGCVAACNGGATPAFISSTINALYNMWNKGQGYKPKVITSAREYGFGACPLMIQSCIANVRDGSYKRRRNPMRPMFV
jgi:hypothetical protein